LETIPQVRGSHQARFTAGKLHTVAATVSGKELFSNDLSNSFKGAVAKVDLASKAGTQRAAAAKKREKDDDDAFVEQTAEDRLVGRVAHETVKLLLPHLKNLFEKYKSDSGRAAKDEDLMSRITGIGGKTCFVGTSGVGDAPAGLRSLQYKPGADSKGQDLTNSEVDLSNLQAPDEQDSTADAFQDPSLWGLNCDTVSGRNVASEAMGKQRSEKPTKAKGKGKGEKGFPPVPEFPTNSVEVSAANAKMILGMPNCEAKRYIQVFFGQYKENPKTVEKYHDKYAQLSVKHLIRSDANACIDFIDLDPKANVQEADKPPILQVLFPVEQQKSKQLSIVGQALLGLLLKLDLEKPKDALVDFLKWPQLMLPEKKGYQSGALSIANLMIRQVFGVHRNVGLSSDY
jgi:hypothetical protein